MNRPDDELRPDAHLRAALRHAPDGDAAPPSYVSARILEEARQAVTPARRASVPGLGERIAARLGAAGRWLRQPGASAAFASLTLATVIGLMWQDGPPPEALPGDPPVPTASAPVATASPPPTPAEPARDARSESAERAAPPAAPAATAARSEVRAAPAAIAKAEAPAAARPRAAAPAPAPVPAPESPAALEQAPPAAAPAPDVPRADDRNEAAAAAPVAPRADSAVADAAPADDASALRERRKALAEPGAGAGARAALIPAPARQRAELAAAAAAADPLADLPAALASTPAAEAWFAELRLRTQGRWQRVDGIALPAEAQAVTAADGRPLGRIALADDAVLWQPAGPDAPRWRATLAPDALARLRAGLAAWAAPARTP